MDFLKSILEDTKTQGTQDIASLVKNAKSANLQRQDTRGFALENEDGSIVKIYVKQDQAEDFEAALSKALYDAEEDGVEIPEMLFDLRQQFDIVDVDWGQNSIPEDEEEDIKLDQADDTKSGDNEDNSSDLDMGDGEAGDDALGDDMDLGAPEDLGDVSDLGGTEPDTAQQDLIGAITKVMDMLKAEAEAKQAEAKARQAEAESKIAQEANKSASLRAAQEEEVLDMEDYNKRKDGEAKMTDTRDKLIKYRHDVNKKDSGDSQIGENMDPMKKKYPEATPEEEEVLDMEEFEKKEKARDQAKKTRERLIKFRHKKKKGDAGFKSAVSGMNAESLQKLRGISFSKFNTLVESQISKTK